MITLTSSGLQTGQAVYTYTRTGDQNDQSVHLSPVYDLSYGLTREIYSVDPVSKRVAGPYSTDVVKRSLNEINSYITYETKSISPKVYYNVAVSGFTSGWSYPVQALKTSLNWNRELLINQAIAGVTEQHINLATFLAEVGQSAALISGTARKIANSAALVRRGNFRGAAKALGISTPRGVSKKKHFADNYLAYKFGVMPLVFDAMGVATHLASRARQVRIRASSRISSSVPSTAVQNFSMFTAYQDDVAARHVVDSTKFSFEQVVLEYDLESAFWDEVHRLGFSNLPVTAWNVIPYSFVVDTFLNIGEWLSGMDQGLGLKLASACYSQGYRTSGVVTSTGVWTNFNSGFYKNLKTFNFPASSKFERYRFVRVPLSDGDIAVSLSFRSPLSVNNAINDSALVVQRLKR